MARQRQFLIASLLGVALVTFLACGRVGRDSVTAQQEAGLNATETRSPFTFVDKKTESGGLQNEMELYALSGVWDLDAFRSLCRAKKASASAKAFTYIVLFDHKHNARFPNTPLTAMYGLEEDAMKHIIAVYEYNKINGFSEINYYNPNMWEGKANTEKL